VTPRESAKKAPAKKSAARRSTASRSTSGTTSAPAAKTATARKATEKKSTEKKPRARKATEKKPVAKKSAARKSTEEQPPEEQSSERSPRSAPEPLRVANQAAEQLVALTGREPEGVAGLERTEDGWIVQVELLELRRIPSTTDVLGLYEVRTDERGQLTGYRRVRRYARGSADDE
jgi:hypothetical protein